MNRVVLLGAFILVVSAAADAAATLPSAPTPVANASGQSVTKAIRRPVGAKSTGAPSAVRPTASRLGNIALPSETHAPPALSTEDSDFVHQTKGLLQFDMNWAAHLNAQGDRIGAARNFGRGAQTSAELARFFRDRGARSYASGNLGDAGKFFLRSLMAYADAAETRMKEGDAAYNEVSRSGNRETKTLALRAARGNMTDAFALIHKLGWTDEMKHPIMERLVHTNTSLRDASYVHANPVDWKW